MMRTEITYFPFANSETHLLTALAMVDIRVKWAIDRARANGLNPQDEFRGLYISDQHADQLLDFAMGQHLWSGSPSTNGSQASNWVATIAQAFQDWQARTEASRIQQVPMLLDDVITSFRLSREETEAFLLALLPEIDPRYLQLYAYLQDDVTRKRPSVDLILNLLTDSFEQKLALRALFSQNGKLFHVKLMERYSEQPNQPLLAQTVRVAPHLVEYLLGDFQLDHQIGAATRLTWPVATTNPRRVTADFIAALCQLNQSLDAPGAVFIFTGLPGTGKQETAEQLAAAAGQPLLTVDLALLESDLGLETGIPLCVRDGRLYRANLYLKNWDAVTTAAPRFLADIMAYPHLVILASDKEWQPAREQHSRPIFLTRFWAPDFNGRLRIWREQIPDHQNLDLHAVANQFRFTPGQIEDALATARDLALQQNTALATTHLFTAGRAHSNQNLSALATKIQPRYRWKDIVLPEDTHEQLHEIVNTVQQRPRVYGTWGFDRKLALGKGLSVLFAGESGTGKTMSADIIAGELGLDLYKIDLSTVVSKYIGETEKNLNRIFTEAATSNAILFFDEADAIFGKRSEVKDSHDRYANIEISYLLQRMETYDGIVILATNLRANLDEAFTRRLHFTVDFPFPEAEDRERIWHVNVPPETPLAANVDFALLAERFQVAGGHIRNIILAAAFLAARANEPVGMPHLLHATRREYQKMGRLIDKTQFAIPA